MWNRRLILALGVTLCCGYTNTLSGQTAATSIPSLTQTDVADINAHPQCWNGAAPRVDMTAVPSRTPDERRIAWMMGRLRRERDRTNRVPVRVQGGGLSNENGYIREVTPEYFQFEYGPPTDNRSKCVFWSEVLDLNLDGDARRLTIRLK